jgi:hypothetical protein
MDEGGEGDGGVLLVCTVCGGERGELKGRALKGDRMGSGLWVDKKSTKGRNGKQREGKRTSRPVLRKERSIGRRLFCSVVTTSSRPVLIYGAPASSAAASSRPAAMAFFPPPEPSDENVEVASDPALRSSAPPAPKSASCLN